MDKTDAKSLVAALSDKAMYQRLEALEALCVLEREGRLPAPASARDVNNHIHTTFSFSPYSPSRALWEAYTAGLCTAGIMDHDTMAGAPEFIEAGRLLGFPVTVGMECRVSMTDTPFAARHLNNPDQAGVAYMTLHGVPHDKFFALTNWMHPYRMARMARTRTMTKALDTLLAPHGIHVDFDRDIWPLSSADEGGSVTERHMLFAVARVLTEAFGPGAPTTAFVRDLLDGEIPLSLRDALDDDTNPHYFYDLLGVLKTGLLTRVYLPAASDECPPLREVIALCRKHDIILAYPYLGDVAESPTGDKKAQVFEDAFLDDLFAFISESGIPAVSYMPSRNTPGQLARVRALSERYGLFQVSGEDINQPRQHFVCLAMRGEAFANLYDSTWALIGHELHATAHPGMGLCSEATIRYMPALSDRIKLLGDYAHAIYGKGGHIQ